MSHVILPCPLPHIHIPLKQNSEVKFPGILLEGNESHLGYLLLCICPKTLWHKTANIYESTVSADHEFEWFWLKVSHEAELEMSLGAPAI